MSANRTDNYLNAHMFNCGPPNSPSASRSSSRNCDLAHIFYFIFLILGIQFRTCHFPFLLAYNFSCAFDSTVFCVRAASRLMQISGNVDRFLRKRGSAFQAGIRLIFFPSESSPPAPMQNGCIMYINI